MRLEDAWRGIGEVAGANLTGVPPLYEDVVLPTTFPLDSNLDPDPLSRLTALLIRPAAAHPPRHQEPVRRTVRHWWLGAAGRLCRGMGLVGGFYDDLAHDVFGLDGVNDTLVYLMPLCSQEMVEPDTEGFSDEPR